MNRQTRCANSTDPSRSALDRLHANSFLDFVNAKGFGEYADGFKPFGTDPASLPGCLVADDFTHGLGDPAEARLAAALQYLANQTCPPASSGMAFELAGSSLAASDGLAVKSPWQENRIYRR